MTALVSVVEKQLARTEDNRELRKDWQGEMYLKGLELLKSFKVGDEIEIVSPNPYHCVLWGTVIGTFVSRRWLEAELVVAWQPIDHGRYCVESKVACRLETYCAHARISPFYFDHPTNKVVRMSGSYFYRYIVGD